MKFLRNKISALLNLFLSRLHSKENKLEHIQRTKAVEQVLLEVLPDLEESWVNKVVIFEGSYNYFTLPSGKYPQYSFVVPELPLYIVVGDIKSASWPIAKERGVSRMAWEEYRLDLQALVDGTSKLQSSVPVKVLVVSWEDPINYLTIVQKIQELLR